MQNPQSHVDLARHLERELASGANVDGGLSGLACSSALQGWLTLLLSDDQAALECAGRSYHHENGFLKLVVFRTRDDLFRLRLHIWPESAYADQNIHDHRFAFWSYVLKGTIINHIWEPDPSGSRFTHYTYHPRELQTQYVLQKQGAVRLKESATFKRQQGTTYHFGSDVLHTISCIDRPVTFVLEDRRNLRGLANVYSVGEASKKLEFESPPLPVETFRSSIAECGKLFRNNHGGLDSGPQDFSKKTGTV